MVELSPGPVGGESLNALVGQDSHVDLQAEQGEHGQGKHGEDDHIPQVLDGLDHRANYRLQSYKIGFKLLFSIAFQDQKQISQQNRRKGKEVLQLDLPKTFVIILFQLEKHKGIAWTPCTGSST